MMSRCIDYVAAFDGSVEDILKANGVSSTICVSLRKALGRVCKIAGQSETPIRLVDRVKSGERVRIYLEDCATPCIPKADIPIDIVYEDEDIAVVDKQAGLAVMPVKRHYGNSLANALANIWGDFIYRPVNRLDKDTSGLMIVAKNSLAHSILSKEHIHREYLALCEGVFDGQRQGTVELPIKCSSDGVRREVSVDGANAVTYYEIMAQYDGYFCAKFTLMTGRTHQIRVHSAHLGYPLCCDRLYNPNAHPIECPNGKVLDRQALHSHRLEFIHPVSKAKLTFVSQAEFL